MVPDKLYSGRLVALNFFINAIMVILIPVSFMIVTKSWLLFGVTSFAQSLVVAIAMPFMPESPKYLYAVGKFDRARDALEHIAIRNGIEFFNRVRFIDEQPSFPVAEEQSIISLEVAESTNNTQVAESTAWCSSTVCSKPWMRTKLLVMMVQWTAVSFINFMMLYELKYFKGNIYYNTICVAIARVFGITGGYWLMRKLGSKRTFTFCYLGALFSAVTILLLMYVE